MRKTNAWFAFLTAVTLLLLATSMVSASDIANTNDTRIWIDAVAVWSDGAYLNETMGLVAGENVKVTIFFQAAENDTDVIVEVELEGDKVDVKEITSPFDVEKGVKYRKDIWLKVPYELKDQVSDDLALNIEIDGKEYKTVFQAVPVRVQRPSYNAVIKSVTVDNRISAGETLPVDMVIKNLGYNDLDDLYVTARISALGVEKTAYFGDLVALEDCDDDCDKDDTVSGRLYLKVPYEAAEGTYTVEVEVRNDDTVSTETTQVFVEKGLSETVIATATSKTVRVGQDAEYSILLVNPSNQLKVYRVITEASDDLSTNADETVVAVPAGSSRTVKVTANADSEGEYNFAVNVFAEDGNLEDSVSLKTVVEGRTVTSPIVVLTIILAIVFLVLLVILIVLLGKKPEKEEFGESYY